MQRQLLFLSFGLVIAIIFSSCDPCAKLDCISSNYSGQFRILRKSDGKDLIFGSNSIYDKTKIRFYSLSGTDSFFFQTTPTRFSGNGYDSIIRANFYPQTTTPVYMKLNDQDTDTLAITYNTFNTRCCGMITEITNFKYNNLINIPGGRGTQEIKK